MKIQTSAICLLSLASFAAGDLLRVSPNSNGRKLQALSKKTSDVGFQKALKLFKNSNKQTVSSGGSSSSSSSSAGFNPETDDDQWPGFYPSFGEDLLINIKLDDNPNEMIINTKIVFQPETGTETSKSIKVADKISNKQVETVDGILKVPIDYWDQEESLYQIEIVDEEGNGICCGSNGNGWITVTDRDQNVVWQAVGNYTYVATAYIWKDSTGDFKVVGEINPGAAIPSGPSGQTSINGTDSEDSTGPTSTPRPTARPTSAPVPSTPSPVPATAECSLCPTGSSAVPDRVFLLDTDPFECSDMEDYFETQTATECKDFEVGGDSEGFANYFRALCECPGLEPACPLCDGEQVEDPEFVLPLDRPVGEELTCFDVDLQFMTMSDDDCEEWDSESLDGLSELCGC